MRVFEGRTAVITGGGTGIGAAVALALAEAGVSISLIGRRLERLQSVAARASGLGAKTACYPTDLADNSAQVELTRRLTRDLRNLDILVQSAGTYSAGPIEEGSLAQLTHSTPRTSGPPTS